MKPSFKAWFFLFRPWSYTATVVPFLAVAGLFGGGAWKWGAWSWGRWALALAAALPLQAACNLLNTWGDERSGVDDAPGAIRTTPQIHEGAVSLRAVFAAAVACVVLSGLLALPLFAVPAPGGGRAFNWPLLVIAAFGLFGACNYATGVKFKYRGLGVPFVFFLMGTVEMAGVACASIPAVNCPHFGACLRSPAFWGHCLAASLPVNCLVAVIMHGNDMRDIPSDTAAGIRTTASTLGPRGALALYRALHLVPYATLAAWAALALTVCGSFRMATPALAFLALPLTLKTLAAARAVYAAAPSNPPWRGLERASGKIHFLFGALYALGLWLAR